MTKTLKQVLLVNWPKTLCLFHYYSYCSRSVSQQPALLPEKINFRSLLSKLRRRLCFWHPVFENKPFNKLLCRHFFCLACTKWQRCGTGEKWKQRAQVIKYESRGTFVRMRRWRHLAEQQQKGSHYRKFSHTILFLCVSLPFFQAAPAATPVPTIEWGLMAKSTVIDCLRLPWDFKPWHFNH